MEGGLGHEPPDDPGAGSKWRIGPAYAPGGSQAVKRSTLFRGVPVNVDPIPQNLIAVHDLLTETLTLANEEATRFGWGVAVFPRTGRFDAPVFGVVTCGGESTTLTYRLLQTLMELPVFVSGRVPATIRDGMAFGPRRSSPPPALLDQPVLHIMLTCCIGLSREDLDRTMPLESTVFAGDLKAPLILLTESRPDGWPR